ncbi:MAG TPA: hypothetical protein VG796_12170 [Verrucomicrobiales bacterium]|nr:hypothetical protein [Verrucomicrobiales bacterium]
MQPKRNEDSPSVFLVKAGNDSADFWFIPDGSKIKPDAAAAARSEPQQVSSASIRLREFP